MTFRTLRESRMREIRPSGSEGEGPEPNAGFPTPIPRYFLLPRRFARPNHLPPPTCHDRQRLRHRVLAGLLRRLPHYCGSRA